MINIPISLGELLDKISILEIKKIKISNKDKLQHIEYELNILKDILSENGNFDNILYQQLVEINSRLWDIEDNIRICEKNKQFNENFINLARSVYFENDKRAEIKLQINKLYNSNIVEVKSYENYK